MSFTAQIQLHDIIDDSYGDKTLDISIDKRLEIKLPDNQVIAIEQSFGQLRLIHWPQDSDNSEPIIIPLT